MSSFPKAPKETGAPKSPHDTGNKPLEKHVTSITLTSDKRWSKKSGAAARGHAQSNVRPCWPPKTVCETTSAPMQTLGFTKSLVWKWTCLQRPAGITGLLLRILECRIFSSTHSSCLGTKASIIPGEEGVRWTGRGRLRLIAPTRARSALSGWNTHHFISTFKYMSLQLVDIF